MRIRVKRILSAALALCLAASLLAVMPVVASALEETVTIQAADSVADIQSALQTALDAALPETVIIAEGSKTDAEAGMVITIPEGVTLKWNAGYANALPDEESEEPFEPFEEPLIALDGAGTFELAGGSLINRYDGGCALSSAAAVVISGGSLEAAGKDGLAMDGTAITLTGGTVVSAGAAIKASADVEIAGGSVQAGGVAIECAAIKISDGAVQASGVAVKAPAGAEITGGTITGGTTALLAGGNILVTGGTITGGSAAYDRGILSSSGVVKVTGGKITATTAIELSGSYGAAVYLAGTCAGNFKVASQGMIIEVDRLADVPGSHIGTDTGLTVKAQSYQANVKWELEGESKTLIAITLNGGRFDVEWSKFVLPALTDGSVKRSSDTAAAISFTANGGGTLYCINLLSGASEPSAQSVLAKEYGPIDAGKVADYAIALEPGARNIYVVLKDPLGNLSSVMKLEAPAYQARYTVTVTGGTGGGVYAPGAAVNITAVVPDGMLFDKWTTEDGVIFANAASASTSFVMLEEDVAVTAAFKEAPAIKYIFSTKYQQTTWNWILFFVCFGWIWMWFV